MNSVLRIQSVLRKRELEGKRKAGMVKRGLGFNIHVAIHGQFTQAILCFRHSTWEVFRLHFSLYYRDK